MNAVTRPRTRTDQPENGFSTERERPGAEGRDEERAVRRRTLGVRRDDGSQPTHEGEHGSRAGDASPRTGLRSRFKPGGLKPRADKPPAAATGAREPAAPSATRRAGRGCGDHIGKPASRREPGSCDARRDERQDAGPRGAKPRGGQLVTPVGGAEGVRLSKVMAERGLCSRREADAIIERGWVFVDGQRVSELGIRIAPDAHIELAPEASRRQAAQVTILLHKPVGYVSGQPEPGFEPAVSLIGADNQYDRAVAQRFHPSQLRGLAPAGRLDIDSTGLLVLTQNGRIARQLIGDDSKIDKEYIVRVEGRLGPDGLALLNHGLELDGRRLRPARVEWINDDQLRFVLREGRKRQIRRMCELVGLKVVGLKRTRIGKVRLGDLPLGQWRFLRPDERF
jgi:23S rRNA pseudouridine2604 synthase